MHHIRVAAALLLVAAARPLPADPVAPWIGAHPVPYEKLFESRAGNIDFEIPFTADWYTDYYLQRWSPRKAPPNLPQITADLAKLKIPVRLCLPRDFDPKRRYPLLICNFTECKDSRDNAAGWAGEAHAAGFVTAGFWMVDDLQKAKWYSYGEVTAAVCVYVASVLARHGPIDPDRIYVGGHSGGAKISTVYYSGYPADYAGLMVLGCNQYTAIPQGRDAVAAIQARGGSLFCGTGKADTVAPPASSAGVFQSFKMLQFPYTLMWDHEEGHAVPAAQLKKTFEFFNTSYADHYGKIEAMTHKTGMALAKAKRYGMALFPLRTVASFKPDSDKGKEAATQLEAIEKAYADAIAEAEKLAADKKTDSAKSKLISAAREFQGSWYQFELVERARKIGK